jgi:hypothetical protein
MLFWPQPRTGYERGEYSRDWFYSQNLKKTSAWTRMPLEDFRTILFPSVENHPQQGIALHINTFGLNTALETAALTLIRIDQIAHSFEQLLGRWFGDEYFLGLFSNETRTLIAQHIQLFIRLVGFPAASGHEEATGPFPSGLHHQLYMNKQFGRYSCCENFILSGPPPVVYRKGSPLLSAEPGLHR